MAETSVLDSFQPASRDWFHNSFAAPTRAQSEGWSAIARGESAVIVAPTGSGKTLAAFFWCIDRIMFSPLPDKRDRCRVLYVSPLKALAVDIERNLRAPVAGISRVAGAAGIEFVEPSVSIRTGDTPPRERRRFSREPSDILITTPESLYLMLTSRTNEVLKSVETVIVDEVHALLPTKRGAHLSLSLERLEQLAGRRLQRIGLSATQRPLDEVARFLGGSERITDDAKEGETSVRWRDVTIVDTGERKRLALTIEVPVEDMADPGATTIGTPSPAGVLTNSIWPAIHPRLLDLIRGRRSTLVFVNNRRLAERLAGALNDLAGETVAHAHHGSLAREQRMEIEERLKSGLLPALVATSSLELGIDMGAIDLVVQIESPPSIASGMQRIGRASHQTGAISEGVIFPKYRGDLVACAALADSMLNGRIEATRYPRNPLDVLAQQIVAMVAMGDWDVEELFETVRRAAPFVDLSRTVYEGVLDMLSGLYPSDEFAELRPRINWNRIDGTLSARRGSHRIAVVNGGTIPDRGLYGVFLAGASGPAARVGELDEEMVFESSEGETFVLGASTWRIEEITSDRVIVSPAPGEPGKTPFWRGEGLGRSVELGREIGAMIREIRTMDRAEAIERLTNGHSLDPRAAENLVRFIEDQMEAVSAVPDDETVVVERSRDELGEWRVCLLSPLGGRVHAPWAMAVLGRYSVDVQGSS